MSRDGEPLTGPSPVGVYPLAAARSCGTWVLYGPGHFRSQEHGVVPFLHIVNDAAGKLTTNPLAFSDSFPNRVSMGKPYGMVVTDDAVVIRHEKMDRDLIIRRKCSGVIDTVAVIMRSKISGGEPERPGLREIGSANAIPAGLAVMAGGVLLADLSIGDSNEVSTVVTYYGDNATVRGRVEGAFVLMDSKDGIIALATNDPEPRVMLIREQRFARALSSLRD